MAVIPSVIAVNTYKKCSGQHICTGYEANWGVALHQITIIHLSYNILLWTYICISSHIKDWFIFIPCHFSPEWCINSPWFSPYLAQVGFISKELIYFQLPLKHDLVTNHTTQNYRAIETQLEIDKVENKVNSGIWFIEKMRGPFRLINFNSSMDKSLDPLWSVERSYFSSITKLHRWNNWCFEMDK